MKKIIKLTESELHNIIENTVKQVLIKEYEDEYGEMIENDANTYIDKYSDILDNVNDVDDEKLMNAINDFKNQYELIYDDTAKEIFNIADDEYRKRNKVYAMSYKPKELYQSDNYILNHIGNKNVNDNNYNAFSKKRGLNRYSIDYGLANRERQKPNYNYNELDKLEDVDNKPIHSKKSLNRNIR